MLFAERWPSGAGAIAVLIFGLALAVGGAASLARSPSVALVRERASGG
jgi:hypothetical protein